MHRGGFNQFSVRLVHYSWLNESVPKLQYTVWPEQIWIKVRSWWQILPQHQSTYLRVPESASIEIPPFRSHFIKLSKTVFYEVNLVSQCSHLKVLLLSKFGSERGDFNWCRVWSSYVSTLMLWWYLSPTTLIQIGSGHIVKQTKCTKTIFFNKTLKFIFNQ